MEEKRRKGQEEEEKVREMIGWKEGKDRGQSEVRESNSLCLAQALDSYIKNR